MADKKKTDKPITKEEYRSALNDVIWLCACAVKDEIPERERIGSKDMTLLYRVSKYHLLTALVAYALESAGVKEHAFSQAKAKAIRKLGLMDAEMSVLLDHMEQARIWYMPLKGTVLKNHYPSYGLRQMADHDILFDAERAEDVRDILTDMGFTAEQFGAGNHDCYYKEPVCNFEMHRSLFGKGHDTKMQEYYSDVKKRLLQDMGRLFGYHFSPEDFYVYMIAHEYKHYSAGGTGLRSLLDTYVYLKKEKPDIEYVTAEVKKLGIADFEKINRSLSLHLFDGQPLTEEEADMLDFILFSGTYGTQENSVINRMRKVTGKHGRVNAGMKMKYYVSRLFPAQDFLYPYYPLAKYKILIPLVWVFRAVRALLMRYKRVIGEIRIVEKQEKI